MNTSASNLVLANGFTLPANPQPSLASLLNGELWEDWYKKGWVPSVECVPMAIRYLRYKSTASCRLVIECSSKLDKQNEPARYIVRIYRDSEEAESHHAKQLRKLTRSDWPLKHEDGMPTLFLDKQAMAVVQAFPLDSALPMLRRIYEPDRLRRALFELLDAGYQEEDWRIKRRNQQAKLLAYKPERRAVFELCFELRNRKDPDSRHEFRWHTKVEAVATSAHRHEIYSVLYRAASHCEYLHLARPVGWSEALGLRATEWKQGKSLRELVQGSEHSLKAEFETLGRGLAELHALAEANSPDLELLDHLPSPIEEGMAIHRHAHDLSGLLPEISQCAHDIAERLSERLSALALCTSSVVHGDLHLEQVMVSEGVPVLIDLDQAGRGYSLIDLGQLVASMRLATVPVEYEEALLMGYQTTAELDVSLLAVTTAFAMFRRCGESFRALNMTWPEELRNRLDLCNSELERSKI